MPDIDHAHIPPDQAAIHLELENWALWLRVRRGGNVSPMFRHYRAPWAESHARQDADSIRALAVERIVGTMPERHREALRWWYVWPIAATRVVRELGMSHAGLRDLVIDGRYMVRNRLRTTDSVARLAPVARADAHS